MKKIIYLAKDCIYIVKNRKIIAKELSFEKGIVTGCINYSHILNMNFKIPKDVSEDLLEIEVEKRLFNEGTLSYEKEYKIVYKYKKLEDFYNVEAFIVEVDELKNAFKEYLKIFEYIDFISASPFVFKSFYELSKTDPKRDVFIYFGEEESFLSCFEKKEFVFVKSLNKLSLLAKNLNLSIEETKKLLIKNGLDEKKYEDKEQFLIVNNFFSDFFMKINNLIVHSIDYYKIEKIDNIYFYSSFDIKKLFEQYNNFFKENDINFKKYELDTNYDYFDYTAAIYNSKNYKNEKENFSIFPRPLPFFKTRLGVFVTILFVSLVLIGIDVVVKFTQIQQKKDRIFILTQELSHKKKKNSILSKQIKKLEKRIKELKKQNIALQKQLADINDKILFLKNIQFSKLTTNELADIINGLNRFDLKLLSFNKKKNCIEIEIVSKFKNSSKIAAFMKYLYMLGYQNISSKEIKNQNGLYISKVQIND
ncbi:MAG TPA: hypothetical protein EYH54_01115 [Nautiliaceae bacterium]|nr:hypothetical protein [Nautiliaceae bacterium]